MTSLLQTSDNIHSNSLPKNTLNNLDEGKPVFDVTSWSPFVFWTYNCESDICKLCKNNLHDNSITYTDKDDESSIPDNTKYSKSYNKKLNQVCKGLCDHVFHINCINKWRNNNNTTCPECGVIWEFKSTNLDKNDQLYDFLKYT